MVNVMRHALKLCAAFVALSCSSRSSDAALADAAGFASAHWTCVRRVEGGSIPRRPPAEFEVWLKGDRALIGATVGGGDQIRVLIVGGDAYSWREGQPKGLKFDSPSTDERTLFVPSVDFVFKAGACRASGKKGTTGTIDGHPFVRYDCDVPSDSTKRVYYFATDLQGFPIHATITYPDHTIVIYDAKSVEVPAVIADSMLQVPSGIQFDRGPG
jgi:hypothetical protein